MIPHLVSSLHLGPTSPHHSKLLPKHGPSRDHPDQECCNPPRSTPGTSARTAAKYQRPSGHNLTQEASNAQVSSPSTAGIAIVPPETLLRESKIPAPERYDEPPGGCKWFLTQCCLVIELQSSSFDTDRAMIAYIISLLSGKALAWATVVWEQQPPSCSSILAFTTVLRQVIDHPVGGQVAAKPTVQHLPRGQTSG